MIFIRFDEISLSVERKWWAREWWRGRERGGENWCNNNYVF